MDILPDELCQQIFALLAGFEQRFDLVRPNLHAFNDAVRAPFRIAATCTRWRKLVLDSPELWSFVYVRDNRPVDDAHLRVCIERSKRHLLDIWIHSDVKLPRQGGNNDAKSKPDNPVIFFEWLDLLQRNIHRWRRIRIDFPCPTPIDKFHPFTQPMPLLEHLVLSTPSTAFDQELVNTDRNSELYPQQLYFHCCPNLRLLASHAAVMIPAAVLSGLECLNFSLRGVSDDEPLRAALAMTPGLKELNIYYPYGAYLRYQREPPPSPLHMPALRRLGILGNSRYFNKDDWDKYLTAPNLETLMVSIEHCNRISATFASFSSTVRHIVLTTAENGRSNGFFSQRDARALDSLFNIETLELRDIPPRMINGNPGEFFRSFEGFGDLNNPVPKWGPTFRKLILRDCTIYLESCGSLASLVDTRTTAARDAAGPEFELNLIGTRFMKRMHDKVPESFGPVMHLFEHSIVAEVEPPAEREE
ncbi:hypothetical protein BKA62DRAFT_196606 [Auriculariales sp. MPI-PUGE-AT-0066]|nr:hypothetical protein BKA62DRAFT_196606 [Auriculariales sp. MPI-PUGE-AT-0066]